MYNIDAVGIRFNIEYKLSDDSYDCSLSVTAFNNSISKQLENEVIYSKDEELTFERKDIDKAVGNILSSLYNKCIKSVDLPYWERSDYTRYFYRERIYNICKGVFSNKILQYTDSGKLEFTILTPMDDSDCSIHGTIPIKLECEAKNNTVLINTFTIKHPSIDNYIFLRYIVSKDISSLTEEDKMDFIKHYLSEYTKAYKDIISANVISMINGIDLKAKVYTNITDLRNSIKEILCISQKK